MKVSPRLSLPVKKLVSWSRCALGESQKSALFLDSRTFTDFPPFRSDNVLTARSIATQCGIFTKGGIIMEGPVFRKLTQQQRLEIVQNLQVLARSSPEDKKVLVETLQSLGEVVGVTGDGTNDGPALKTANVGFS